jgi:hypothetical protein
MLAGPEDHRSWSASRRRILHDEDFHRFYYCQQVKLVLMGREDSTLPSPNLSREDILVYGSVFA